MGTYEKRPCAKGCKKMLDPRGAHKHERTCGGESGTRKRSYKRRKPKATRRAAHPAAGYPEPRAEISPGCLFCAGASQALAKDLVVEAIRGGMALDPAVALVWRMLAASGRG
ncbi:MAG: hypothetical protein HY613_03785 [Candidatus Rokubacteria bacterium]|nr:hypothetical protein [Candidatus Rokubacteria bacterium]